MKKLFTLFLALVASVGIIYASDTQVDGIWYDFTEYNKTASVTYRGSRDNSYDNEYSGSVVIPPSVTYDGTTYSVTSIGNSAFNECSALTSVTIPNSITSIANSFQFCTSLTSITIPNSVTSIGAFAFNYCTKLTSVTIGNGVTSIEQGAFQGCLSLTSITIPNSVTSIEEYAFHGCSALTSINVDSNNPNYSSVDGVLFNKDKTTLVAYPGGKQGAYTIPNSVTSIEEYAFRVCSSITSVTIPNSVTSIGYEAFLGCDKLVDIYCYATTPPVTKGEDTFSQYNAFLYVPCESTQAYMVDAVWGKFKFIECISSEDIENVQGDQAQSTKVIKKDGQVLILRNGKTYTMQGQEVK